jgi:aspartyl-tRNA(Asn)/glutamyl-tRNA(Gln) amidotransferase subunit A
MNRRTFGAMALGTAATLTVSGCKNQVRASDPVKQSAVLPDLPQAEIGAMSAVGMAEAFRAKALSPVEATKAILERIDVSQKTINAYSFIDREVALKTAKEAEARWVKDAPLSPLDGVPTGIKDQYQVAAMPQLFGSKLRKPDPIPSTDELVITRLRKAGLVLLGKTTQPEEGSISASFSALTGITRNPYNLDRTAGGSSSGAGAAAAAGLGPIQMAADGGGSIREPASYCGVYGFKPTPGTIPRASSDGYAVYGPICQSLGDIRALMQIAAGDFKTAEAIDKTSLRIAYMPAFGDGLPPQPDVLTATDAAVERLRKAGFKIEKIDPILPYGVMKDIAFGFYYEDAMAVVKEHGLEKVKAGMSETYARFIETTARQDPEKLGPIAEAGFGTLDAALKKHPSLNFDIALMPGLPITAFDAKRAYPAEAEKLPDYKIWMERYGLSQEQSICLAVGSYLKLPEIAMPCGKGKDGMPVSLIASAKSGSDARVLAFAEAVAAIVADIKA